MCTNNSVVHMLHVNIWLTFLTDDLKTVASVASCCTTPSSVSNSLRNSSVWNMVKIVQSVIFRYDPMNNKSRKSTTNLEIDYTIHWCIHSFLGDTVSNRGFVEAVRFFSTLKVLTFAQNIASVTCTKCFNRIWNFFKVFGCSLIRDKSLGS